MNEIEQIVDQLAKSYNLYNVMFVSTGEENANNISGNLKNLFELLNVNDTNAKNKVFVCSRYYDLIRNNLLSNRFLENEDFFDARDFFLSGFDLPLVRAYDNVIVNM